MSASTAKEAICVSCVPNRPVSECPRKYHTVKSETESQVLAAHAFASEPAPLGATVIVDKPDHLLVKDCASDDRVNHPAHYGGDTVYECIKVLEAWGLHKDFCLGNAVKYISRAGKKGEPIEDLRKAEFYIRRAIEEREKGMMP